MSAAATAPEPEPEHGRQHYNLTLGVLVDARSPTRSRRRWSRRRCPRSRGLAPRPPRSPSSLTAFLLTASVATPIIGRLGDMFGKERMLVDHPVVFAVGRSSARCRTRSGC